MLRIFVPPGSSLMRDSKQVKIRFGSPGKVAIVGVPWDWSTSGRPGARFAPQIIRRYLFSLSIYSPSRKEALDVEFEDLGDVAIAPGDPKISFSRIAEAASEAYKRPLAVFLGGDHSITRWTLESLLKEDKLLGLLVLDAHYDMRTVEEGMTSGSWLWDLLTAYGDKVRATVIGIQDYMNPGYLAERAKEKKVDIVTRDEIVESLELAFEAIDRLKAVGADYYYISIDMDHLCEACAPGVNSPSPLGMTPIESYRIIKYAARSLVPKGIDVTEITPAHDLNDMTSRLAAFLIAHAIHEVFLSAKG